MPVDDKKIWAERFPHPGEAPARPTTATFGSTHDYNTWARKSRKHLIARAVDTLLAKERAGIELDATEVIAVTLGLAHLDDNDANNIFGMFG